MFSNIISAIIEVLLIYALWKSIYANDTIAGTFEEAFSYLMLMNVLSLIYGGISGAFSKDVKNGNIVFLLLRPQKFELEYIFENIGIGLFNLLTKGLVFLIPLFYLRHLTIYNILPVIIVTITGYFVYIFFELNISIFSFYNYSIWGIESLKEAIQILLSGKYFPAFLYPKILNKLSKMLPFYYCYGAIGNILLDFRLDFFIKLICVHVFFIVFLNITYKILKKNALAKLLIQGG